MTIEASSLQSSPIITFSYIMQVFISLLIVVALIYFISRYVLPKMKDSAAGKIIKVLDRVYLEPQVSAYILKAGKSAWLIAVSNKSIVRIDKVEDV